MSRRYLIYSNDISEIKLSSGTSAGMNGQPDG